MLRQLKVDYSSDVEAMVLLGPRLFEVRWKPKFSKTGDEFRWYPRNSHPVSYNCQTII